MAKFTVITTVVRNHIYHDPPGTIDLDEKDPETKTLLDNGVIKYFDPKAVEDFKEKNKKPGPYEDDLTKIKGIGQDMAFALNNLGIRNFDQLAKAPVERLIQLPNLSERYAKRFISEANSLIKDRK